MKSFAPLLACSFVLMLVSGCGETPSGGGDSASAAAMKTEQVGQNKAVCAKLITAINKHDVKMVGEQFDAKFKDNNPMPGSKGDKESLLRMFTDYFTGFPDSNCVVDLIIGEDDLVAMKITTTGTNTGPCMGKPATNKAMKIDELHIARVKDGKIVEHWGLQDDMTMMMQLGMMPPPETKQP